MRSLPLSALAAGASLLAATATASTASAFKPEGHEAIEALAYRLLAQAATPARVCTSPDDEVTGIDVLRTLIDVGALEAPACFDIQPGSYEDAVCAAESSGDSSRWPRLGSGAPDNLFARQFGGDGQCFHFMAEVSDVYGSAVDPAVGVRGDLVRAAYQRCTGLMNTLWLELLGAPDGSRNAGRGLYALMHAVEDSFSAAHTERDVHGRIVYLRPWDLLSLPYTWHFTGGYFGTDRQHAVSDARDDGWRSGEVSPRCPANGDPYVLAQTEDCYSPRGKEAARAVEDLLKVTYCGFRQSRMPALWGPGHGPRGKVTAAMRTQWTRFVEAHLSSASVEPTPLPQVDVGGPVEHPERTPELLLGLRGRGGADPSQSREELAVALEAFPPLRNTYPFVPLVGVDGGVRWTGRRRQAGASLTLLAAMLPLSETFALTLQPAQVESYWDLDARGTPDVDVLATLRADVFLRNGTWVSLTAPRWGWVTRAMRWEGGLTIGYAWDLNAVASLGDSGYRDAGTSWSFHEFPPPAIDHREATRHRKPVAVLSLGMQPNAEAGGYGVRGVFPELLYTPDWLGETFDFGGALIASAIRDSAGYDTTIGLASRARVSLPGRWLGVGVTPVEVDVGDKGAPRAYVGVTTWGHVFLRLFDVVEAAFDYPLVHWYDSRTRPRDPWFVRFGWVQGL